MSLVILRKCPVLGCKFNKNPIYADFTQIKRHLKHDHDYKEKQETAFALSLISSVYEKRSSVWFTDSLARFSNIGVRL